VRQYALQVLGFLEVTFVYCSVTICLKLPTKEFQDPFINLSTFCLYCTDTSSSTGTLTYGYDGYNFSNLNVVLCWSCGHY